MTKAVLMLGSGGHASVLLDAFRSCGGEIVALVTCDKSVNRSIFHNYVTLSDDEFFDRYSPEDVQLINGIGPSAKNNLRSIVAKRFYDRGYEFISVISKFAIVSEHATINQGAQILTGAIIHPGVCVAGGAVVNTAAIIEHDCTLGINCHIAPRATLCGQVTVGKNVFVGSGATVIENVTLHDDVFIGSGAVVTHDLTSGMRAYGFKTNIRGS